MEDKLNRLRSALDETVFKQDHFTEKNVNNVREKIQRYQQDKPRSNLRRLGVWYKPTLSAAVCLILFIGTIYMVNDQGGDIPDSPQENRQLATDHPFPYPDLLSNQKGKYYVLVVDDGKGPPSKFWSNIYLIKQTVTGVDHQSLRLMRKNFPKLNINKEPYYIFFDTKGVAFQTDDEQEAREFLQNSLQESESGLNEQAAIRMAKRFKKAEFEVDFRDIPDDESAAMKYMEERCRPYLTVEAYKNLYANRIFTMASRAAENLKSVITIQDINFEKYEDSKKENSIDFNYEMKLVFKDQQGNTQHQLSIDGQMTVTRTEDGWKISRDWSEKLPPHFIHPQSENGFHTFTGFDSNESETHGSQILYTDRQLGKIALANDRADVSVTPYLPVTGIGDDYLMEIRTNPKKKMMKLVYPHFQLTLANHPIQSGNLKETEDAGLKIGPGKWMMSADGTLFLQVHLNDTYMVFESKKIGGRKQLKKVAESLTHINQVAEE